MPVNEPGLLRGDPAVADPLPAEIATLRQALMAARAALRDHQRQAALSETRLGVILENLPDGFFAVDRDLRFTYVNVAVEQMWGVQRADLLGRPIWEVVPNLVNSNTYQAMLAAGEQGRAVTFEERSAVHTAWVAGRAFPIPDGIAVAFQDTSARHDAELAWQESEARYRMLFNTIDVGFCIVDVIFDAAGQAVDYRFLEANPVFSSLTGLHEPIGKTARELVPSLDESWFAVYGNVARTGEPLRFENDAPAMDNRWFDVYAFRVGNEDSRRVAIFFTNITERKRLAQAQRDFVGMVGHDLGNPLAVLRGWAQLMQRRQQFDPAGIDAMLEQAKRMERLVSDLREYVKFETGRLDLHLLPADLVEIAQEALGRARMQAPRRAFVSECPAHPVIATVDRDRLGQVLDNLLSNAHKYTPSSAPVTLRVSAEPSVTRVEVIDQGDGIPPAILPRLFDRFYRGEQVGTIPGLGLGLYIARMLIESQGGTIRAASTPGQGTTFIIPLPADAARSASAVPPAAAGTAAIPD